MGTLAAALGLVLLAVVVASVAHRLSTPAPSLLVIVGLGLGFVPGVGPVHLSPDVIVIGVLPPLLFAAAEEISLPDLRAAWGLVSSLAVGLVMVTAVAVAVVTRVVAPDVGLAVAFVLGAVLASTDPVAVTALSRQLRLPPRVATVVQAESLFNDATSLVLFQVAVAAAVSGHLGAGDALGKFALLAGGGVGVGLVVGGLGGWLVRAAHQPVVQAALALLLPYVAAVAAELATVSPVTAVIVAGLLLGRRAGRPGQPHSAEGRELATHVYAVVGFLLENAVFAVIGLALAGYLRALPDGSGGVTVGLVAAVTATLLLTRATALAAAVAAVRLRRTPSDRPIRERWAVAAVVTWAGARGVVPLAAVLAVPARTDSGAPLPGRALICAVATSVVVVTLVVQGTTLAPLVRRLGVRADPP